MSSSLKLSKRHLQNAVHQSSLRSQNGVLERVFTFAFKGLVYPQIWEDPRVDMQALNLPTGGRMITIASGGCNVLSYLTQDPQEIIAVDLNRAHIALNKLKLSAAKHLPNYDSFYRFFGEADEVANLAAYNRFLKDNIDAQTRQYWQSRDWTGRRRITLFSRDLYHHGMLGYFIGATHLIARFYGVDLSQIVEARSLAEQRNFFDKTLAPLFDKRMVRWVTSKKMSLYGLGIPPAQYEALCAAEQGDMAAVLRQRLQKLTCDFAVSDNYFAWQAFTRGYAPRSTTGPSGPLPPYLEERHFDTIRQRVGRVRVEHRSVTDHLAKEADASLHGFVLLDAQDWMTDQQLNELWQHITRTAAPGARVIFRTAAEPSLLPGRVEDTIIKQWTYETQQSEQLGKQDRSSIYGGFHIYTRLPKA
ncbi:DUF3419 family protein [Polycladidibacter hongkongensis]|uniref:DUF3419 family protein n=1 Tax=Polycladidibacter hongkongensis TaxID=1647556 RepID=UPI000830D840|nr:DUF3419 family protein [Pseudovibrio hongkongensis]